MIETLTGLCGQLEKLKNPPQQEFNSANNMQKATSGKNDVIYQLLPEPQDKVEARSTKKLISSFTKTPGNDNQELPTINPNTGKS